MASTIFDKAPFKEFREYLEQLKSSTGRILYDNIDLKDIYSITPWVYVLDVGQDGEDCMLTFKFVGEGLCKRIGFDPSGKQLEDLDFGDGQVAWREGYRTIVKTGRPHVLSVIHYPDVEKMYPFEKGEATCLLRLAYPTYSANGEIKNLIGVGQFIPLADPEANKFYEFTLDELTSD